MMWVLWLLIAESACSPPESREHNGWSSCLSFTGSGYSKDHGYDSSETDNDLPEAQWQEYLELCRNLKPAPDKTQWDALKPLRQQLDQRFKLTLRKRMMLEILWPQSQESRSSYVGQMDRLFKAVPTISQLHRIYRAYEPQKMKDLLDACLA